MSLKFKQSKYEYIILQYFKQQNLSKHEQVYFCNNLNKLIDVIHEDPLVCSGIFNVSIPLNVNNVFGQHSAQLYKVLFEYRNSFWNNTHVILNANLERDVIDGLNSRRLVSKTQFAHYSTELILERQKKLEKLLLEIDDPIFRSSLEMEYISLQFIKGHPGEIIYVHALDSYFLGIHTHSCKLVGGKTLSYDISLIDLNGDMRVEYMHIIPVPKGYFPNNVFDKIDNNIYTDIKVQMKESTLSQALCRYQNYLNQFFFTSAGTHGNLRKEIERAKKFDYLLSVFTGDKVE